MKTIKQNNSIKIVPTLLLLLLMVISGCSCPDDEDNGSTSVLEKEQVTTLAGSVFGFADGIGIDAKLSSPLGLTIDASGNLYVVDADNERIRKITPEGVVSTFAGNGEDGFVNATGTDAEFNSPEGIAIDASGNFYVADRGNHKIRKITPEGVVSTFAGSDNGYADGTGTNAQFNAPNAIAIDASGNLYVVDRSNYKIRKITPAGVVSTLAGSTKGFADGTGANAQFNLAFGIVADASSNVYVADALNNRIRKITPNGVVSTLAGSGKGFADGNGADALFNLPWGLAIDNSGNLYVADRENHKIRKITPNGVVSTVSGSGAGYLDGARVDARFHGPFGILVDNNNVYVSDTFNSVIRKIILE